MRVEYDAAALATVLSKWKASRPLANMLRRLDTLYSIATDLDSCQTAVEIIDQLQLERGLSGKFVLDQSESAIDAALYSHALILYARSTDTNSDKRGKFNPRKFYDEDQVIAHSNLIQLRNEAVAHFGYGNHPSGSWANDRAVVIFESDKVTFGYNSQRVNYKAKALRELRTLLPLARAGLALDNQKLSRTIADEIATKRSEMAAALAALEPRPADNYEKGMVYTATWTPLQE